MITAPSLKLYRLVACNATATSSRLQLHIAEKLQLDTGTADGMLVNMASTDVGLKNVSVRYKHNTFEVPGQVRETKT